MQTSYTSWANHLSPLITLFLCPFFASPSKSLPLQPCCHFGFQMALTTFVSVGGMTI